MHFAIPFVVFTCTLVATVAFEHARTDRDGPRVPSVTDPAFTLLEDQKVARYTNASAAIYEQQIEGARITQAARTMTVRWLRSQLHGARVHGALPSVAASPPHDLAAVQRWANDLPARHVTVVADRSQDSPVTQTSGPIAVRTRAVYAVRVHQTRTRQRTFRVPVEIMLRRNKGAWRISGVRFQPGPRGLGGIEDPIIVTRGPITVVTSSAHADFAKRVAVEGARALPQLHRTYAAISGASRAAVYIVDAPNQSKPLLGRKPATRGVHPRAWTYDSGDVVMNWKELATLTPAQRDGVVWHELVHVITLPLGERAPLVILEGLATREESTRIVAGTDLHIDLADLRKAFRSGELHYQQLLTSDTTGFDSTNEQTVARAYLAGYATVAFLEDRYSLPRFVELLARVRAGKDFMRELEAATGLSAQELEHEVRVWVTARVRTDERAAAPV